MSDPFAADETTLVPGRLRVYRCWRLEGTRLVSTGHDFIWRSTELDAECLRYHVPHSPAPAADCSCGIYGWYHPADCRIVAGPVFGCVEVWGRVVLGSNGVRAEHARIVALAPSLSIDTSDVHSVLHYTVATVSKRLSVPMFTTGADLVNMYPPEDLSALGIEPVKIPTPHRVFVVAGSVARAANRALSQPQPRRYWQLQLLGGALALLLGLAAITSLIRHRWGEAVVDVSLFCLNLRTWCRGIFW